MNSKKSKLMVFLVLSLIPIFVYHRSSKDQTLIIHETEILGHRKNPKKINFYAKCSLQYAREIDPHNEIYYIISCHSARKFIECSEIPTEFNKESRKISEADFELYRKHNLIWDKDLWKNPYWVSCYDNNLYLCSKGKDGEKDTEDDVIIECPNL
jgi:hypothetical protein